MANAILTALRTQLLTSTGAGGFMNLFGSRVYLSLGAPDAAFPLCVYSASQIRYERGMNGSETHSLSVVFTMYTYLSDPTTLPTGQTRLRTLLDGVNMTATGYDRVRGILRDTGSPELDEKVWSVSDTYELIGQQTA